ncbi:hypothetical protein MKX03_033079 [Papaver bracteatum]|nr:hypothetical protein MKX03_033079 [Papaver bracteatum]
MGSENTIAETMRSIENMWRLFYQEQNSRNSPTLDEDGLGFKRVINNIVEHVVQSQLKTFEEKYFKSPPKKCPNCGKMKKAGRKMVIAVDAARRFAYFWKHPQQPSSVPLVSDHSVKDGHSGNQNKSVRFQLGQETMERHSKWEDIPHAQERLSPKIMKKYETQQRISSPKKKKVSSSPHRYNNSFTDVILAPTLMQFDPDIVESRRNPTYSDSSSFSESKIRSRSISPARSATSSTGSNSPSRYQRTSSWESKYSTYSTSSSSGNEREPHPRVRMPDHRRLSMSISRSRSSEDYSRSRSPDEVYSHRKRRDSNLYLSTWLEISISDRQDIKVITNIFVSSFVIPQYLFPLRRLRLL